MKSPVNSRELNASIEALRRFAVWCRRHAGQPGVTVYEYNAKDIETVLAELDRLRDAGASERQRA